MNKKAAAFILLFGGFLIWWTFFYEADRMEDNVAPDVEVEEIPSSNPMALAPKKSSPDQPIPEVEQTLNPTYLEKKKKVLEKIETLGAKLRECEKKAQEAVSEQEIQQLESKAWELDPNSPEYLEQSQLISQQILEKISQMTMLDWHLEEIDELSAQMMTEDFALVEPEWILKVGSDVRPCGVFRTHRLMTMWVDLLPPQNNIASMSPTNDDLRFGVVSYVRNNLGHRLGASGVSMQIEVLINLADKGYLPNTMKDSLRELEQRLHDGFVEMAEGSENDTEVVQSIIRDYSNADLVRRDVLDLVSQYFPEY